MNAAETTELINTAGGNTAFAKILGITEDPGHVQRINNWKRRGIPARVVLEHQPVIEALRRKARSA